MKPRPVWFTQEASFGLQAMPVDEQQRWAARIDRIAGGRPYRATRPVRGGPRHLFRLETDGWLMLYRAPPGRGRITIVAIALRRLERLIDAAVEDR